MLLFTYKVILPVIIYIVQHKILVGQNFGEFGAQLAIHQSFIRQVL